MNDIKLQSPEGKHPLDENLRPLKVGTTTSPLELSKTDVKVKNLTVSGSASFIGDTTAGDITLGEGAGITSNGNIDINADADLTLNIGGVITLDSATGVFEMKGAGTTAKLQWGSNSANRYPDFIMKATALPASIST